MRDTTLSRLVRQPRRLVGVALALAFFLAAASAQAADQVYFSSNTNITNILVQKINAETVRLDVSSWYLSEHAISIAIDNRFAAGVPVRIIGDRGAIFEADPHTKTEFYWLASQGVPIRLRFNPTWFPEIDHWKAAIFNGQHSIAFGSANFAPTELAPVSSSNYGDDSVMFTDDPDLVNAFKTKFDVMWNDTTREPSSILAGPPYLKNWDDACANEPTGNCGDYRTQYPNPVPMIINTARLEPDYPMPADMYWGQGPEFNNRLIQEINNETTKVDIVVYRLSVPGLAQALLTKFQAGVPVRVIVDPAQYTNNLFPEYWLTHAYIDALWAAGVPVVQRVHDGVTHLKTLITSTYATNASSNFTGNWQRDHDYFVSIATKPAIYQAFVNRFQEMWQDTTGFGPLVTTPPNPADLVGPASGVSNVATTTAFSWNRASWAVSYDIYLGTSPSNMTRVANVPAQLVQDPPSTYSWTPTSALAGGTTYWWKVVSLTYATPVNPSMSATSSTWSFTTGGGSPPPPPPPPDATDIVIYASDVPAAARHGSWTTGSDGTSPNGVKLTTPDNGVANTANALASPVDFVDVTFSAPAGTSYRLWMRLKATGNSKFNDSLWVQFSDAVAGGSPVYPLNTTSGLGVNLATDSTASSLNGWGWQNTSYWLSQATTLSFASSGTHTLRIQVREDGVDVDQIVLSPTTYMNTPPGPVTNDNTIVPKSGSPPPPPPPPPPPTPNVVIYASDIVGSALHGSWTTAADPTSPNGVKLTTPDNGVANTNNALASPTDFVDVTFNAVAGTPYRLWLRIKATANSKFNDAVWVQFSDAMAGGSSVYPLNSTSGLLVNLATDGTGSSLVGWGWQNTAYWLSQTTTITFASSGTHTLRIQVREDGVQFDQIVLSPSTYLNAAPGPVSNDNTIVAKP